MGKRFRAFSISAGLMIMLISAIKLGELNYVFCLGTICFILGIADN